MIGMGMLEQLQREVDEWYDGNAESTEQWEAWL